MSYAGINILGELSPEEFLKTYWQKKPCLIRNALPDFKCPVSPDELAGLACEDNSRARLVIEDRNRPDGWDVEYGPFSGERFRQLPATHWSLLVSHVEHYLSPVNELLNHFNFIPNWRIDDVMISYAADHGSVGPHLDSYDVFLLQGPGQRHWQINRQDYSEKDFIPGLELRIINNFRAENEWILNPGDMLYLPPGVAHHGVAQGPAMTLSIGFLAPLCSELVGHFINDVISGSENNHRFTDPDRTVPNHAGEITSADLARIRRMMQSTLADENAIKDWFGHYITASALEPEAPETMTSIEEFLEQLQRSGSVHRYANVRTSYIRFADCIKLYMHGHAWQFSNEQLGLVQLITGSETFYPDNFQDPRHGAELGRILLQLYNKGFYYFDE